MKYVLILLLWWLPCAVHAQIDTTAVYAEADKLIMDSKYEQALPLMEQLIATDTTKYKWYYDRGYCYAATGNPLLGYDDLTKAIALNPRCADCYTTRAILSSAMRSHEAALSDMDAVLQLLDKGDTLRKYALTTRGGMKYNLRDYKGAIADLEEALAIDSTNSAAISNLTICYAELDDTVKLERYVKKAMKMDSTSALWLSNIGFVFIQQKKYDKAWVYMERAVAAEKKAAVKERTGAPYNNRGYLRYLKGDYKGALKDINKALEVWEGNSYAFRNRALVYIATKEIPKACEDIEHALRMGYTEQYGDDLQQLQQQHCNGK